MLTIRDITSTDTALVTNYAAQPINTKGHCRFTIIKGIEMPRYANTKFSEINPAVSTKNSTVIFPQALRE